MMEYINRKDTMEKVRRMPRTVNPDLVQYSLVKGIIAGMPAADVAPVVYGKVTHVTEDAPYCEYGMCNVCGAYVQNWNYCPNCGAKMDGET